jgi:Kdo2-lipid IVA lauroyltransferase/acyltransferase
MKISRNLQNRIEYILFRGAIGFLKCLPLKLAKALIIGLFNLVGYHMGIRRKLANLQLTEIFPRLNKLEKQHIIKHVYRNMALNVVDVYLRSDEELYANSKFVNKQYLAEALDRKKGVLLMTGHFGSWEAPCRILPMEGYGLAMITKRQRNRLFDAYTNAIRERQGGTIIDMKNALKGVLVHTGHNDLIGILIDQDAGRRGVLADFMGKPASNWKGTAKISLRFKIPIVPGYVIRNSDDTLTFKFEKMIDPLEYDDNEENIMLLLKRMNESLEEKIRQYPEQWFWVHKRWKGARFFKPTEMKLLKT